MFLRNVTVLYIMLLFGIFVVPLFSFAATLTQEPLDTLPGIESTQSYRPQFHRTEVPIERSYKLTDSLTATISIENGTFSRPTDYQAAEEFKILLSFVDETSLTLYDDKYNEREYFASEHVLNIQDNFGNQLTLLKKPLEISFELEDGTYALYKETKDVLEHISVDTLTVEKPPFSVYVVRVPGTAPDFLYTKQPSSKPWYEGYIKILLGLCVVIFVSGILKWRRT